MSRFFRYLRIAFSATCLIVCVLLIVLWVRSYSCTDLVTGSVSKTKAASIVSVRGQLYACTWYRMGQNFYYLFDYTPERPIFSFQTRLGFGLQNSPNGFELVLPFWFVVALISTVAAAPWLSWQYSLRTLLIATTMIAVVLGVIAWSLR